LSLLDLGRQACPLGAITEALAREREFLRKGGLEPTFTVALTGYLDAIREPWIGLITDTGFVPDWDQDACQIKGIGVAPFRVHFAIRQRCAFVNGRVDALSPDSSGVFERILEADGSSAYELAKLIVKRVREAARKDSGVGERVSAIVMPAPGWVDTCLWDNVGEPVRTAMPRMVFQDGTQWEPSEVELDFQDIVPSRLQRHALLFHRLTELRYPRRVIRALRRWPGPYHLPTTNELLMFSLYPERWDVYSNASLFSMALNVDCTTPLLVAQAPNRFIHHLNKVTQSTHHTSLQPHAASP
jgi:hypothetical protein